MPAIVGPLLACALLASHAQRAQGGDAATPQSRVRVVGRLVDPQGQPVAGAELQLLPEPQPELPALTGLLAPAAAIVGASAADGRFALAAPRGVLLATTGKGLGAIALACQPGRYARVIMQPMAAVTATTGTPFTLSPALVDDAGMLHHLPAQSGTEVRLPAGVYEVWFQLELGAGWQRLDLRAGQKATLQWTGPARAIRRNGDARVHPASFPHVALLDAGRAENTLLGAAARAPLAAHWPGSPRARLVATVPPGDDATPWPPDQQPPFELQVVRVSGLPAGVAADAWALERTLRGGYRLLAHARSDDGGRCGIPWSSGGGDHWLLITAPGCVAVARERVALDRDPTFALAPGRTLTVMVLDPEHNPATGVVVELEPADGGPAAIRTVVDDSGRAVFEHAAAAGTLRIDDPNYLGLAESVEAETTAPRQLQLAAGSRLRGRALLPDGSAAAFATVTLRDPQYRLRPPERTVRAAADGTFCFRGLPPDAAWLLFAQWQQQATTWSASARTAPGTEDCLLQLRNEDPQIVPDGAGR